MGLFSFFVVNFFFRVFFDSSKRARDLADCGIQFNRWKETKYDWDYNNIQHSKNGEDEFSSGKQKEEKT